MDDNMAFWKNLLADRDLRSRFLRDLEIQDISTRSAEDLAQRYREEEILPRHSSTTRFPARAVSPS